MCKARMTNDLGVSWSMKANEVALMTAEKARQDALNVYPEQLECCYEKGVGNIYISSLLAAHGYHHSST